MEIKPGLEVINLKHKVRETVVDTCKTKTEEGWKAGVIYTGIDRFTGKPETFVRELEDFKRDFIPAPDRSDMPAKIPAEPLLRMAVRENKELKALVASQEARIRDLEEYITSDQYKLDKTQKQAMRKEENYKMLLDRDKVLRDKNKELLNRVNTLLGQINDLKGRMKDLEAMVKEEERKELKGFFGRLVLRK